MIMCDEQNRRFSFFELFSDKKFRIVIPIIQRDYAQGRKTPEIEAVRKRFLEALWKYLDEEKPFRDLDFIYGTFENNERDFIPLDGQQRLTTLFLLHWYLAQITKDGDLRKRFYDALREEKLSKDGKSTGIFSSRFTYRTRRSSQEFCDELMNFDLNKTTTDKVSETIRNQKWFCLCWENDPTIQSMLVMLDEIQNIFSQNYDYLERLMRLGDQRIITFLLMNLDEFKLTEDLYIKMNSRGKALTPFENFKAEYEQWLKTPNEEISPEEGRALTPLSDYFTKQIDTEWLDYFWRLCETEDKVADTDKMLTSFIRHCHILAYANQAQVSDTNALKSMDKLRSNKNDLSFTDYSSMGALTKDSARFLVRSFDALELMKEYSDEYEKESNEEGLNWKELKRIMTSPAQASSYYDKMFLYACLRYLQKFNSKEQRQKLPQWLRIVHNLTHPDNTITDNDTDFIRRIQCIEKQLLPYAPKILEYFSTPQNNLDIPFPQYLVKEECIKAQLLLKNTQWQKKISETEQHGYFVGQIGFLLDFAGIVKYYDDHGKKCDWDDDEDKKILERFRHFASAASAVFEPNYSERQNFDNQYLFERAVITLGDYTLPHTANRFMLCSSNVVDHNIKRDFSWRRILRLEDPSQKERQALIKTVLEGIDPAQLKESLRQIINGSNTAMEYWRQCLQKEPGLFQFCKNAVFYKTKDAIYLYTRFQAGCWYAEFFSYYLWLHYLRGEGGHFRYQLQCSSQEPYVTNKDGEKTVRIFGLTSESDFKGYRLEWGQKTTSEDNGDVQYNSFTAHNENECLAKLAELGFTISDPPAPV